MNLRIKAINMLFGASSVQEDGSILVYKNDTFTTPTIDDLKNIDNTIIDLQKIVDENSVPQTLTPIQFRLQLNKQKLRPKVETMIAESSDFDLKDWWEYSTEYKRDNPILIAFAKELELSDEDVDNFFIAASQIV